MTKIEQLNALLQQTPNDPFLYYAIALELVKAGNPLAAIERFELLVNEFPTYTGTYYQLGKLYEALNNNSKALSTYSAGLKQTAGKELRAHSELQTAYQNLLLETQDE